MTYNKSEIMKRAWELVKKAGKSMSEALKESWAIAKDFGAEIKDWFEAKLAEELGLPRLYFLKIFCGIKETEKAVYAMFNIGHDATGTYARRRCAWIPKSAIENLSQLEMIADYDKAVARFKVANN